jgi:hypothetical protein
MRLGNDVLQHENTIFFSPDKVPAGFIDGLLLVFANKKKKMVFLRKLLRPPHSCF